MNAPPPSWPLSRGVVTRVAKVRSDHGLFDAVEKGVEWGEFTELTMGAPSQSVLTKVHY